jgi:uncharacterized protein (DUF1778 family)
MARNSTHSTRLEARLSPQALALVKRAAEIEGRSVRDFVVTAARQAAQRTIAETQVLDLALADRRALAEALANPPKPARAAARAQGIAASSPGRGDRTLRHHGFRAFSDRPGGCSCRWRWREGWWRADPRVGLVPSRTIRRLNGLQRTFRSYTSLINICWRSASFHLGSREGLNRCPMMMTMMTIFHYLWLRSQLANHPR